MDNIDVLRKAVTDKVMNPEKMQVLANWINTEKLNQLKEEQKATIQNGNHKQNEEYHENLCMVKDDTKKDLTKRA